MNAIDTPFVCALSGIRATQEELETLESEDDTPQGWIRLTIERKRLNPWYARIQQCIQGELHQNIEASGLKKAKLKHNELEEAVSFIETQLDAKYAPALATSKYEKWIVETEDVYISPPDSDAALSDEYNKLRQFLALEADDGEIDVEPVQIPEQEEAEEPKKSKKEDKKS